MFPTSPRSRDQASKEVLAHSVQPQCYQYGSQACHVFCIVSLPAFFCGSISWMCPGLLFLNQILTLESLKIYDPSRILFHCLPGTSNSTGINWVHPSLSHTSINIPNVSKWQEHSSNAQAQNLGLNRDSHLTKLHIFLNLIPPTYG